MSMVSGPVPATMVLIPANWAAAPRVATEELASWSTSTLFTYWERLEPKAPSSKVPLVRSWRVSVPSPPRILVLLPRLAALRTWKRLVPAEDPSRVSYPPAPMRVAADVAFLPSRRLSSWLPARVTLVPVPV